jgi:hypothetical protein
MANWRTFLTESEQNHATRAPDGDGTFANAVRKWCKD